MARRETLGRHDKDIRPLCEKDAKVHGCEDRRRRLQGKGDDAKEEAVSGRQGDKGTNQKNSSRTEPSWIEDYTHVDEGHTGKTRRAAGIADERLQPELRPTLHEHTSRNGKERHAARTLLH